MLKFELDSNEITLVLDECGTEIDDDDVMKEYKEKVFIVLAPVFFQCHIVRLFIRISSL